MGIDVNAELSRNYYEEVDKRKAYIAGYESANKNLQSKNNFFKRENENLNFSINRLIDDEAFLYSEIEEKEEEIDTLKYKNFKGEEIEKIPLSNFLENLNKYPNYTKDSDLYYKGVLINSFYELEFNFFTKKTDKNFNEILRCRCVSIGIPNIRKNYTAVNFNGRRVEIEQNAEFQHEIQIRIICDEDTAIYYKFKEYIDCTKNKEHLKIFNDSFVYIYLNGYKVIQLNYITISDLGQLEFDNSPGSSISFFNVTLKIIDYEFIYNLQKNKFDKLTLDILENNKRIENIENEMNYAQKQIDENSIKIKNNERIITENNEIIARETQELEFFKNEFGTYFN